MKSSELKPLMIVLAHNEEQSIVKVIKDLKKYQYDFIVINDASDDNTAFVAKEAGAYVISHRYNLGPVGGMQTGMKYAMNHNYNVVMQFDGDGQHLAKEVDKVLELIRQGNEIAIGSRFKNEIGFEHSMLKTSGRKWLSWWIKKLSKVTITDPSSGFRAYTDEICQLMLENHNIRAETDSIPVLANMGFKVEEVQVKMDNRETGESFLTPINAIVHMLVTTLSMIILSDINIERQDND